MNLLALDTTSWAGSIALARDGRIVAEWNLERSDTHAERLLPGVDFLLRSERIAPCDLDAVAVVRGPGSFTGLRIGISSAKSLALAIGKPLFGVTSLEAMAHRFRDSTPPVVVVLDAQRGKVFAQAFDLHGARATPLDGPLCRPGEYAPAELASLLPGGSLLAGDGLELCREELLRAAPPGLRIAHGPWFLAGSAAQIASFALQRGESPHPAALEALYVRAPDAEKGRGSFCPAGS